jgi:membrane associated rhomboid family serine protease
MHASLPPPLRAREPILNLPSIVAAIVLGLIAVHAARSYVLSEEFDFEFLFDLAAVPARWTAALDPFRADAILREAVEGFSGREALARQAFAQFVLSEGGAKPWTAVTYAALHGSWTHVLINSVWLAAFGTPVARRCGAVRFAALLLAAAFGGAVAHALVHPLSSVPMIGASAAVSGLMAAAARFVFAPREQGFAGQPAAWPTQSFRELLRNRRAALFLAIWFGTNLLFGLIATPLGVTDASIAWEAHIGGFIVGLLLFPLIEGQPRRPFDRD